MFLTWRAVALAAIGVVVVAVLGNGWALLGLISVLAALLSLDLALTPSPRRLIITRGGEHAIRLGEQAEVWVQVHNKNQRRLRGRIRDAWTPSAGAVGGVDKLDIPARQRREHVTTLHPYRRGDRRAGPVVIRSNGPLGLAGREHAHEVPRVVRVLPAFSSRKHLPSRLSRLHELDGRATLLQRGQGTEFDSLREYLPGDDVRSIDWRATARSQMVVVKTWRPERDRHVLIVLDSGRTSAGRVGDAPKLDHAMDAALLLTALASRAGDRVDLLIVDREVRASVSHESASQVLSAFVNAMAPVEARLTETNYRLLVQEALQRVSQRSFVVIFTALDSATLEEGLLPVLGPLVRKHRVTVAAVSDPRLDELRHGPHEGFAAADAYAAAAAEAEAGRRQTQVVRLERTGLMVVQAPPEQIAPDLADHYLALKKAGRL